MKKKIFVISLAVCLLALSIAGTSMAYFTDVEEATNTFTAGNVDISLTYKTETTTGTVTNTANDEANPPTSIDIENTKLYPGEEYNVEATISNIGKEDAYVGAIITLSNTTNTISGLITTPDEAGKVDLDVLFKGINANYRSVEYDDINNQYKIYVIKKDTLAAETGTAAIFNSLVIPTTWDNKEMKMFAGAKLTIKAYATQTKGTGFENAASALKTAFTDWAGCTITTPAPNP